MTAISDIRSFKPGDRGCIIPFGVWSNPVLDALAKWRVTVFTCEKTVLERLQGRTDAHFLPPPPEKFRGSGRAGRGEKARSPLGLFGEWVNPFDPETVRLFDRFLSETKGEPVIVGRSGALEQVSSCRVIIPIQSSPALSPLMMLALQKGIPVLLPESSRPFFPAELPVRYYDPEDWKSAVSEALSNPAPPPYKNGKKARAAKGNEFPGESVPIESEAWASFLLHLAWAVRAAGDSPQSEEIFLRSREAFEKCGPTLDSDGKNDFGVCLAFLKDPEKAKDYFRRAGSRSSAYNLSQILFGEGAYEEALDSIEKCLSGDAPFTGMVLGGAADSRMERLYKGVHTDEEREKFLKAEMLRLKCMALISLERKGEALLALKEAVALDPDNPFLLHRLAALYMEKRMVAQPLKVMNDAIKKFPFFFEGAYRLASYYAQVELYDQALALCERYSHYPESMNSERFRMADLRAYIHFMKGNLDTAIDLVKENPEMKEGERDREVRLSAIYLKKGAAAYQQGELDEAERWAEESLKSDSSQALAANLLGSISFWKGEFEEAARHFRSAASLNQDLAVAAGNIEEAEAAKGITVSLIVVSHNDPQHASRSLRLLSEYSDLPHEIIHIRPSSSLSWDFLKDIPNLRSVEGNFPGRARAYNYGAAVSRGKHLVFLEDDVVVANNWLSHLVSLLEQEGVGAAGPVTDFCSNSDQRAGTGRRSPFEVQSLDGFCMAVKRQIFKEAGGFDEVFRARGYEDVDLSLKIKLRGKKLMCHPGVILHHEGLLPVIPPEVDLSEIDAANRKAFVEKWKAVKDRVESHA